MMERAGAATQPETVRVALSADHLRRIAGSSVQKALQELIWNALDADAFEVVVEFEREGVLGGTTGLRVRDNGHGMTLEEARQYFGMLGDSWKKSSRRSQDRQRILHGEDGEGRFRAFALGDITWTSLSKSDSPRSEVVVSGLQGNPEEFQIREGNVRSAEIPSGTIVSVSKVDSGIDQLLKDDNFNRLCGEFGPYLRKYPGVTITIDGKAIDAASLIVGSKTTHLKDVALLDNKMVDVEVEILEWAPSVPQRVIYLCNTEGFALYSLPSGLTHFGFNYSVYARSDFFTETMKVDGFTLAEMDGDLQLAIAAIKGETRNYLRSRNVEQRRGQVEGWKNEAVYPYEGDPATRQEAAERQVFDIVAANVTEFVPGFEKVDVASRRFQFRLLQQALQNNPASLQVILNEVLVLPKDRQDDLADLLQHSTLSDLIHAARTVADRLSFLHLLESLVYDSDSKKTLLERRQLHRIVASQTWLFGERFNLVADDQSLTEVLRKHAAGQGEGRDVLGPAEVLRADGSRGIVDLMLGRSLRGHGESKQENLIVELKRPRQPITLDVISQVDSYADAIVNDPRFSHKNHSWTFIAVSTGMDRRATDHANQPDRPAGFIRVGAQGRYTLWAKTWSELIEESRAGLDFVNSRLSFTASDETAAKLLNDQYAKYFESTGVTAARMASAGARAPVPTPPASSTE